MNVADLFLSKIICRLNDKSGTIAETEQIGVVWLERHASQHIQFIGKHLGDFLEIRQ